MTNTVAEREIYDFLQFESLLSANEKDQLQTVKLALSAIDDDMIVRSWEEAEFPHQAVQTCVDAGLLDKHFRDGLQPSSLLRGLITLEIARMDASLATFVGVTGSLFGLSVYHFGSEAQRRDLLPKVGAGELIGAFALTEPESGSDISRGMSTAALRDGDDWILEGEKRWIGNGTWADRAIVWAREHGGSERILGFVVPTDTPGWSATKIDGKYSLRAVQNANITLTGVRVSEQDRLPGVTSFREISEVLKLTRLEVAWTALGNAVGAFDKALQHAQTRSQFDRQIAGFQLVQDLLVRAEALITTSLATLAQTAHLAEQDRLSEEQASLAKLIAASNSRQAVALCREVFGGDGIVLENKVIKHFMDAEAIYTFEGTHQLNTLIVGRSLTGVSAFV